MNASLKTPFDCFCHTLRQCCTNLSCAPFFLLAVLFYAFYYCWPYEAQLPDHIDSVIVDEDNSHFSRAAIMKISADPHFRVIAVTGDRAAAIRLMRAGKVYSIIGIPANFEADALNDTPTSLTLVTNGAFLVVARSEMLGASAIVARLATAAISEELLKAGIPYGDLAEKSLPRPPAIVMQAMYNTISGYLSFAVAIVFVIIFQSIMCCGICMLLNDWFQSDPEPQALTLARKSPRYLLAVMLPVTLICWLWILGIEGAAFAWQGINSFQNIGGTLLAAAFFAFAVSAAGLFLGMSLKKSPFAIHIIVTSSLACVFISGNLFPWQDIPLYMRCFAWLLPSTPGVDAILRASQAGATPLEIFPYLMHLLALALFYFALAWLGARKKPAHKAD